MKSSIFRCVNQLSRVAFVSFAFTDTNSTPGFAGSGFQVSGWPPRAGFTRFRQKKSHFVAFWGLSAVLTVDRQVPVSGRARPTPQDTNNVKNYIPNFTHGGTDYMAEAGAGVIPNFLLVRDTLLFQHCAHHLV